MGAIRLNAGDNIAIATKNHLKGDVVEVEGEKICLLDDVPLAHKIALFDICEGMPIIKYDNVAGYAKRDIKKGEWVHTHNDVSGLGEGERSYKYEFNKESIFPGFTDKTFMGYERKDGKVGIRNYIAVISTVFCANGPMRKVTEMAKLKYPETDNFDGVIGLEQPFGCSQHGEDKETALKLIARIVQSANFGGVLLVANGCETNPPELIMPLLSEMDPDRIRVVICQDVPDEFEASLHAIDELYETVIKDRRTEVNLSRLHIAANCGGSDGLSGITANTLVGTLTDRLVSYGATVSMTEVPEMMGAEHILMNRAKDEKVFSDIVSMMEWYYDYLSVNGMPHMGTLIAEGNMAGGLSTLEEKSLGCINKGGHAVVTEVLKYSDVATENGLILVTGPGNDVAGVTGQIAAGAVLTVFTTGRGTPCGFAGPTFRLSSNKERAALKPHWIDYDAGRLIDCTTEEERQKLIDGLYDAIIDTCNGKYKTCTEKMGYYMVGHFKQGLIG